MPGKWPAPSYVIDSPDTFYIWDQDLLSFLDSDLTQEPRKSSFSAPWVAALQALQKNVFWQRFYFSDHCLDMMRAVWVTKCGIISDKHAAVYAPYSWNSPHLCKRTSVSVIVSKTSLWKRSLTDLCCVLSSRRLWSCFLPHQNSSPPPSVMADGGMCGPAPFGGLLTAAELFYNTGSFREKGDPKPMWCHTAPT